MEVLIHSYWILVGQQNTPTAYQHSALMLFTTSTCNYFPVQRQKSWHHTQLINNNVCIMFRKPAVKEEILSKLTVEAEANLG